MRARYFGNLRLTSVAMFAATALSLPFATESFAQSRCDSPANAVDRTACAKAKESPEELRRYVWRTRGVYQLYFWDYITPEEIDRLRAREIASASPRLASGK